MYALIHSSSSIKCRLAYNLAKLPILSLFQAALNSSKVKVVSLSAMYSPRGFLDIYLSENRVQKQSTAVVEWTMR